MTESTSAPSPSPSPSRDARPSSPLTSGEGSGSAEKAALAPAPAKTGKKLPGWLDHFNARDLKVLFRCSLAAWVASLLIFITPSLATIGTATFFAT
jgi:hypothetical protein